MTTITTSNAAYPWRPDATAFAPADAVPEALILRATTVAGQVDGDAPSVRVAYVDDADASFVAEAATIDESNPTLSEVVVHTGKIAQLVALSNEQWNQEQTAGQLAASVARAITKRADEAFIDQTAPVGPAVSPPAGLLNIDGVIEGDEVDGDLDALVDLIAELESNGATPSVIIVDPLGWAAIRKFKLSADSNASLLGAGSTDAAHTLLDVPVVVNRHVTPYSGLAIDSTAVVSAVGPVNIAHSEHAKFASDSVLLRATWRIGWNCVRPDRIGKFTIAGQGS